MPKAFPATRISGNSFYGGKMKYNSGGMEIGSIGKAGAVWFQSEFEMSSNANGIGENGHFRTEPIFIRQY